MDEKIRKALDKWADNDFSPDELAFADSIDPDRSTAGLLSVGFYAGYRAALDALPSREEIEDVIYAHEENVDYGGCKGLFSNHFEIVAAAIDALIRGKV